MTAIVGIINRNGVAFAADSAATHSLSTDNKKKITNHANKVFELSKYHPIGVAICGGLSLFGVPWEDCFKLYRNKLERKSFPYVKDFAYDFMSYMETSILPKFVDEQRAHFLALCKGLKNELIDNAINQLKKLGREPNSLTTEDLFPVMIDKLSEFISIYSEESMKCGSRLEGYSITEFEQYSHDIIDGVLVDLMKDNGCHDDFRILFKEALFRILVSKVHVYLPTTEIIFWGYGEDELFPSCHSIIVSAAFDGLIKWSENTNVSISNTSPAWILPFAQTDVSNTVVRGVDHSLRLEFGNKTKEVLERFKSDLVKKFGEINAPQKMLDAMSSLSVQPYAELYVKWMDSFIQDNYVNKLMDTVGYLMKEDLADMAESLVRMTCLKRHFTTDEETVGGPVDVAVATRGDGFVWIKRKHYFSADINHHYFER